MSPLLTVSDLRVRYRVDGTDTDAVAGVDLRIERGETVAVVGESGSGKSTLAHAIIGLLPRNASASGRVELTGDRIDDLSARAFNRIRGARIGFVPQDPGTALNPVQPVGDQVAEVLRIHGRAARRTARAHAVEHLVEAGLDDADLRYGQLPHQLSGGQRQRVLIAIAAACEPELIIADEPTSALDVTVQRRILDHLEERTSSGATALLLITHDIGVAADRADRIIVMAGGRIVETGTAQQILDDPQHGYTRRLIADAPGLTSRRLVAPIPPEAPIVARAEHVSKTFRVGRAGRIAAVNDVSLRVRSGETLALVGESGSGKTTTARILAGLESNDAGRIEVGDRRSDVGFVYQNPYAAMNPKLTVAQIIAEPLGRTPRAERDRRVRELLIAVALDPALATRRPTALSGGQRQRVAIARALATTPRLLILDEPVSALDVTVQAQVLALLADLQRDHGIGYLFISHDLAVVRQISHRVAVMRAGDIVEEGDVADIFGDPRHDYTRQLIAAIPGEGRAHRPTEATHG
ncbi:ABC transporter ATP-binding protein [Gordonia sp. VNQ95]|uniref:ABC transporter ATP-binding protein n=1 Tax=Gordonia sp. VNQ95 TaxID=3156619 RepID=UPI0032B40F6D